MVFILCADSLNMLTALFSCTRNTVQRNNLTLNGSVTRRNRLQNSISVRNKLFPENAGTKRKWVRHLRKMTTTSDRNLYTE
jgi:hypothetical protein